MHTKAHDYLEDTFVDLADAAMYLATAKESLVHAQEQLEAGNISAADLLEIENRYITQHTIIETTRDFISQNVGPERHKLEDVLGAEYDIEQKVRNARTLLATKYQTLAANEYGRTAQELRGAKAKVQDFVASYEGRHSSDSVKELEEITEAMYDAVEAIDEFTQGYQQLVRQVSERAPLVALEYAKEVYEQHRGQEQVIERVVPVVLWAYDRVEKSLESEDRSQGYEIARGLVPAIAGVHPVTFLNGVNLAISADITTLSSTTVDVMYNGSTTAKNIIVARGMQGNEYAGLWVNVKHALEKRQKQLKDLEAAIPKALEMDDARQIVGVAPSLEARDIVDIFGQWYAEHDENIQSLQEALEKFGKNHAMQHAPKDVQLVYATLVREVDEHLEGGLTPLPMRLEAQTTLPSAQGSEDIVETDGFYGIDFRPPTKEMPHVAKAMAAVAEEHEKLTEEGLFGDLDLENTIDETSEEQFDERYLFGRKLEGSLQSEIKRLARSGLYDALGRETGESLFFQRDKIFGYEDDEGNKTAASIERTAIDCEDWLPSQPLPTVTIGSPTRINVRVASASFYDREGNYRGEEIGETLERAREFAWDREVDIDTRSWHVISLYRGMSDTQREEHARKIYDMIAPLIGSYTTDRSSNDSLGYQGLRGIFDEIEQYIEPAPLKEVIKREIERSPTLEPVAAEQAESDSLEGLRFERDEPHHQPTRDGSYGAAARMDREQELEELGPMPVGFRRGDLSNPRRGRDDSAQFLQLSDQDITPLTAVVHDQVAEPDSWAAGFEFQATPPEEIRVEGLGVKGEDPYATTPSKEEMLKFDDEEFPAQDTALESMIAGDGVVIHKEQSGWENPKVPRKQYDSRNEQDIATVVTSIAPQTPKKRGIGYLAAAALGALAAGAALWAYSAFVPTPEHMDANSFNQNRAGVEKLVQKQAPIVEYSNAKINDARTSLERIFDDVEVGSIEKIGSIPIDHQRFSAKNVLEKSLTGYDIHDATWKVAKGQNLWEFSKKLKELGAGNTFEILYTLVDHNNIKDKHLIKVGEQIQVPNSLLSKITNQAPDYTVARADLEPSAIADIFDNVEVDNADISQANKPINPTNLGVQKLDTSDIEVVGHIAEKGDSYWSLANKFLGDGKLWKIVREANKNIADSKEGTDFLGVGDEVEITKDYVTLTIKEGETAWEHAKLLANVTGKSLSSVAFAQVRQSLEETVGEPINDWTKIKAGTSYRIPTSFFSN